MTARVKTLWKRADGKCYFCDCQTHLMSGNQTKMNSNTATREHLIPKSEGGSNRVPNLVLSCHKCNKHRGTMCALMWMRIVRNPFKLKAFHRTRQLSKQLTKMRKAKKRKAQILEKRGIHYEIIKVDKSTFNRLFTDQCAA